MPDKAKALTAELPDRGGEKENQKFIILYFAAISMLVMAAPRCFLFIWQPGRILMPSAFFSIPSGVNALLYIPVKHRYVFDMGICYLRFIDLYYV